MTKRKLSRPETNAEMRQSIQRQNDEAEATRQRAITDAILDEGLKGHIPVGHAWNPNAGYVNTRSYPMGADNYYGGFWAKSGPCNGDRGGTWNN